MQRLKQTSMWLRQMHLLCIGVPLSLGHDCIDRCWLFLKWPHSKWTATSAVFSSASEPFSGERHEWNAALKLEFVGRIVNDEDDCADEFQLLNYKGHLLIEWIRDGLVRVEHNKKTLDEWLIEDWGQLGIKSETLEWKCMNTVCYALIRPSVGVHNVSP